MPETPDPYPQPGDDVPGAPPPLRGTAPLSPPTTHPITGPSTPPGPPVLDAHARPRRGHRAHHRPPPAVPAVLAILAGLAVAGAARWLRRRGARRG